jgi:hypothetical protein
MPIVSIDSSSCTPWSTGLIWAFLFRIRGISRCKIVRSATCFRRWSWTTQTTQRNCSLIKITSTKRSFCRWITLKFCTIGVLYIPSNNAPIIKFKTLASMNWCKFSKQNQTNSMVFFTFRTKSRPYPLTNWFSSRATRSTLLGSPSLRCWLWSPSTLASLPNFSRPSRRSIPSIRKDTSKIWAQSSINAW